MNMLTMGGDKPRGSSFGVGGHGRTGECGGPVAGEPMPSLNREGGAGISRDRGEKRAY